MKLNNDPFLVNTNMVELNAKKVLVQSSQVELTKGKDVIVGEKRAPMMIKPQSLKGGQWQKNERGKPQQCPEATFNILMAKYKEGRVGARGHKKLNHPKYQTGLSSFLGSGQGQRQGSQKPDHPKCQIG
jgi:hypothetical protein